MNPEERIAQLEAAFWFYAEPDHYEDDSGCGDSGCCGPSETSIEEDGGRMARGVLGIPEPKPKKAERTYYSPPKPCPSGEHRYHRSPDGLRSCEQRARRLAREAAEREAKMRWLRFDDGVAALKATEAG